MEIKRWYVSLNYIQLMVEYFQLYILIMFPYTSQMVMLLFKISRYGQLNIHQMVELASN